MPATRWILTRDVTPEECKWLGRTITKGETVYTYHGHTFKLISKKGYAFTFEPDKTPFFELLANAVTFSV